MQASTTLRYLRIAPRKVRLVAQLIKGKKAAEARAILQFTIKGATEPLGKALHSAVASAKNNFQLEEENLYISKIMVAEGPKLKRYRPRARGRAFPIEKKTSHITIVLDEITPTESAPEKKSKTAAATSAKTEEKKKVARQKNFRPTREAAKPKAGTGSKRIFRRKAI
jgi:large subunit ribosomal protein L22